MIACLQAIFLSTVAPFSFSSWVYSLPISLNFGTGNAVNQSIDLTETEVRVSLPIYVSDGRIQIGSVGENNCPDDINHNTWRYRPDTPVAVLLHNTILQKGARCDYVDGQKVLELYYSDKYADFEAIRNAPPIPDDVKGFWEVLVSKTTSTLHFMKLWRTFSLVPRSHWESMVYPLRSVVAEDPREQSPVCGVSDKRRHDIRG